VRLLGILLAVAAPPLVPWIAQRPVEATARPPLAPACRASQLRAELFLQGATGSLVGGVQLTNAGPGACALLGRPRVSFAGGTDRVVVQASPAQSTPDDALVDPPGSLRALAPGKAASVSLWWSNWCGSVPTALRLELPSGTAVVLPLRRASRCDDPSAPSTIQVGPFQPALRHLGPSSRLPLVAAILGPRPVALKPGLRAFHARSGTILRFVVALTNTSPRPLSFGSSCPVYEESLDWPHSQVYVLNCRAAGPIPPHRSVRFAMRLRVPPPTRTGVSLLTWELAPTTYLPPSASAAVQVVR